MTFGARTTSKFFTQSFITQKTELAFLPVLGATVILMHDYISKALWQSPSDVMSAPLVFTCLGVCAVNAILFILLRNIEKSSVITLLLLIVFYSLLLLEPFLHSGLDFITLVESLWAFLIFALFVLFAIKRHWANVGTLFNALFMTIALFQVFVIFAHDFKGRVMLERFESLQTPNPHWNWKWNFSQVKPDVYYVIIDGCGSDEIMKSVYNDDQSAYTARLRELGFLVPAQNHSNYSMTLLSLAATLNMEYINSLATVYGKDCLDFSVNNTIIRNNRVSEIFRNHGYKIVNVSSGFGPTWWIPAADINLHQGWFTEYQFGLLQKSLLVMTSYPALMDALRELRLGGFEQLEKSVSISGPKFVFTHIVCPHPPYLFGENGEPVKKKLAMNFKVAGYADREVYSDQADFMKKRLMKTVEYILKTSKKPPIIVLQSDHGPASLGNIYGTTFEPGYIRERMGIFNALYMPGVTKEDLPADFTSVNTFKVVFNKCFGGHIPLDENKSYISSYSSPFNFHEVTSYVIGK